MKLRPPARLATCAALAGLMVLAATPALAQTTTAGGSLTNVLQTITSRMNLWLNPRVALRGRLAAGALQSV
jgi:hypothetical protein